MSLIKKNFLYNLSYQILTIILPIITIPYVSRVLGPENIGVYSYTLSIANYFLLFSLLGVKNYGSRTIAQSNKHSDQINKRFWEIYFFQVSVSVIMVILYLIYIVLFQKDYTFIAIIQLIIVLSAAFDISWFYFGIEKFKLTAIRGIVIRVLGVALIFILVSEPSDLWLYVLIMASTTFFSQLALWPFLFKYVRFVKPTLYNIKKHIKPNLLLFIPVISISFYNIMDKVMVGQLSTMTQLGFYENTERITTVPFSVVIALGTVMIPRMSNLISKGEYIKNKIYIKKSMKYIIFLGSAISFGIGAVAPTFAPVFFGDEFFPVSTLMTVMSPIIIFKAWASVIRTQYLIPTSRDKEYVSSVIFGAIVNLIINFLLISSLGALGAVIGTIIAEFVVAAYQTIVVRKELEIVNYFKMNIVFILNGLIMLLIIRKIDVYLTINFLSLAIEILLGAFIYLILSIGYLYILKDEIIMRYANKIKLSVKNLL